MKVFFISLRYAGFCTFWHTWNRKFDIYVCAYLCADTIFRQRDNGSTDLNYLIIISFVLMEKRAN